MKKNNPIAKCVFFTLFCCCCLHTYAQQGNVWCFGRHAGLDFNSTPPKMIWSACIGQPVLGKDTACSYNSASICDCKGNLLFYCSNAGKVYNRNHQLMPKGNLANFYPYYYYPIYIMPVPGSSTRYYIFYFGNGLSYSIVDMTYDNGLGDIDATVPGIAIDNKTGTFTLSKHPNDTDFWILHQVTPDTVRVYPVNSSGIQKPKKQHIYTTGNVGVGRIKANHKGDRVAFITVNYFNLNSGLIYSFNPYTGVFLKPQYFGDSVNTSTGYYKGNYGDYISDLEFSPNDSLLYAVMQFWDTKRSHSSVVQYDAYASQLNGAGYTARSEWHKYSRYYPAYLQLGPDGKIYVTNFDSQLRYMNVIDYPNKRGTACHYRDKVIDFSPNQTGLTMPNVNIFIHNLYWGMKGNCADTATFTNLSDTVYYQKFRWYFGDGDSSDLKSPKHQYKKTGSYVVRLRGTNACGYGQYYSDTVKIYTTLQFGFNVDSVRYNCQQATLYLQTAIKKSGETVAYDYGESSGTSTQTEHTYSHAGIYTLAQVVNNGFCTDTFKFVQKIDIQPRPSAAFSQTLNTHCQPFIVKFNNQSINSLRHLWFFDGIADTALNPTHVFKETGYHKLILIAANTQGCADTISNDKAVYVVGHDTLGFSYSLQNICTGMMSTFINPFKNANAYVWKFGDGSYDTAGQPVHIYHTNGTYPVSLITYNQGCSDTLKANLKINIPVFRASFVSPFEGCLGHGIQMTNTSKGVVKYYWTFGDGTSDTTESPMHYYKSTGGFATRLAVQSADGCKDTVNGYYIFVQPGPKSSFYIKQPKSPACHRLDYEMINTSPGYIDSFRFDFGDGTHLSLMPYGNPASFFHTYTAGGIFKVKLIQYWSTCSDTSDSVLNVVINPLPVPDFSIADPYICSGAPAVFINKSFGGQIYNWDFGDHFTSSAANPSHYYHDSGIYTVTLTAYGDIPCVATIVKKNFIVQLGPVTVDAKPYLSKGCSPVIVQFLATANPEQLPLTYSWDFGDGTLSTDQNPLHLYTAAQGHVYQPKVRVSNGHCTYTSFSAMHVYVNSLDPVTDKVVCKLVTVEDNSYAHLYWEHNRYAAYYIISRSDSANGFQAIGTTRDSEFVDTTARVQEASYHYRIMAIDTCKSASAWSSTVSTVYLHGTSDMDDIEAGLAWNDYLNFRHGVNRYELRKDQSPVVMGLLDSFTDKNFYSPGNTSATYELRAYENGTGNLVSMSNKVTLAYHHHLWIPDAFTPNNDHLNDGFGVGGYGIKTYHIEIYNRLGIKVFQSENPDERWSGKNNTTGVYIYLLHIGFNDGQTYAKKGNITLLN